jgi:hypothetical protein
LTEPAERDSEPDTREDDRAAALMRERARAGNFIGKLWNAPNTASGLAYGGIGHGLGKLVGKHPRIRAGRNAIEFVNNPLGGAGAITLGNTTTYSGDPYDPQDPWLEGNHTIPQHEEQHTYQGELLGPFYFPSNLAGGLSGLIRDGRGHGPSNWNESGPAMDPPRPGRSGASEEAASGIPDSLVRRRFDRMLRCHR